MTRAVPGISIEAAQNRDPMYFCYRAPQVDQFLHWFLEAPPCRGPPSLTRALTASHRIALHWHGWWVQQAYRPAARYATGSGSHAPPRTTIVRRSQQITDCVLPQQVSQPAQSWLRCRRPLSRWRSALAFLPRCTAAAVDHACLTLSISPGCKHAPQDDTKSLLLSACTLVHKIVDDQRATTKADMLARLTALPEALNTCRCSAARCPSHDSRLTCCCEHGAVDRGACAHAMRLCREPTCGGRRGDDAMCVHLQAADAGYGPSAIAASAFDLKERLPSDAIRS